MLLSNLRLVSILVSGVLSLTSLVHYFIKRKQLPEEVATHFNILGKADRLRSKKWFVIYPALNVIFWLMQTYLHVELRQKMPNSSYLITAQLTAVQVLLLTTQFYASTMTCKDDAHIPPLIFFSELAMIIFLTALIISHSLYSSKHSL